MSKPRMRPVFDLPLQAPAEVFFATLSNALAHGSCGCKGQIHAHGALLRLRSGDQRVWSPALHVEVLGVAGGTCTVHGRFSPSSPVWTAFIAIYVGLACLFFAAISYGGAQVILGETAWAFWGAPLAIALAGFTYGAAFIGQGLGAEDMHELRSFVECVVDQAAMGRKGDAAAAG